jgi:hypothetical protein
MSVDEQERVQVKFEQDGNIFVKYKTVQFWLWPTDYADIHILKTKIKETVKDRYESRYAKKWGRRMTIPPPPQDYDNMASEIMKLIRGFPHFIVWQIMFA